MNEGNRILTVKQTVEAYPGWTMGSFRYLLLHRKENGLARAIIRAGKQLRIDEREWLNWLNARRESES